MDSQVAPQLMEAVHNLVQQKVSELEHAYHHELQACDGAWQEHQNKAQARESALQIQIQGLTNELEAARIQLRYVFTIFCMTPSPFDSVSEI